jgi:diguanylate cyclase (GGDEF)-like protein/PAS domain S-box-containing protein
MLPEWKRNLWGLLIQFTGVQGGVDNVIVVYGIAAIFYAVLFIFALAIYRDTAQYRDYLLTWGFGLGFVRETFMLIMAVIQAIGLFTPQHLHQLFPPLEHLLIDLAMICIASGYIGYLTGQLILAQRFMKAGFTVTVSLYLVSAWWWFYYIRSNPTHHFADVWCDPLFHANGAIWMLLAGFVLLIKSKKLITRPYATVMLAINLMAISTFLKIPDIAFGEVYINVFAPIGRTLYLIAILMLGYCYFIEDNLLRKKMNVIRQQYKAAIDSTHEGLCITDNNGVILEFNNAYSQFINYTRNELIGINIAKISNINDMPALLEEIFDKSHFTFEVVQYSKDGTNIEFEVSADYISTNKTVIYFLREIGERKQTEEKLRLAANVFTYAHEGIMITESDGTIVDVNNTFSQITGYSRDEVIGQNPRMLSSGRYDKDYYTAMWRDLIEKGHWYGEIWNRHKNGEVYAEMQNISAVRDANGNIQHYVSLFSDITLIKNHEQELEYIAHYDALTNLPNRVLLADRLQQAMLQVLRREQHLVVVFLDLDGFKAINDNHGHRVGDQFLMAAALSMKQTLREDDTLARLGGDEFIAVLTDLIDIEASVPMLTRLLAAAAQPVHIEGLVLQVSASLGATVYPQVEDIDADQLLRQADQAMYQAKVAGKNRYHIFDAAHDTSIRVRHESLDRIHEAIINQEFELYYQPKVNMRTGAIIGVEALIRWNHPEKGLLSPALFLPEIEDHPLAIELGEWVIDTALTQIELWRSQGLDVQVSVNVGARQLQQTDFVIRLHEILAAHPDIMPSYLELEVLETSALEDITKASLLIDDCRKLGVSFALDDFGTGYSSLTYLKRLPVVLLKIDQSFVRDMLDDSDDLAIIKAVVGLARTFRRDVIAEGVETVEHGTMLLQLGCELAQGYGIARPMPADQLPSWSTTWRPDPAWVNKSSMNHDGLPMLFASVEQRS